jgi:integrase
MDVIDRGTAAASLDAARGGTHPGLLAKLMTQVRPAFRVEVFLPDPDDPVLGTGVCAVSSCARPAYERGMCSAHYSRWSAAGAGDVEAFLADPGPPVLGTTPPRSCAVPTCLFGSSMHRLCARHVRAWERAGRPEQSTWAGTAAPITRTRPTCLMPFCGLWTEYDVHVFCKTHTNSWRQRGRPDPAQMVSGRMMRGRARIDLRPLTPQLRLEFGYALQCRHDEAQIKVQPATVNRAVRHAHEAGVASLLDLIEPAATAARRAGFWVFIAGAVDALEMLIDGTGWERQYAGDVWRLHRMPGLRAATGSGAVPRNQVRFESITQPWLKDLTKRWARLRLSTGRTIHTVTGDVLAISRFSGFLRQAAADVSDLAHVDRPVLERYLAWLSAQPLSGGTKGAAIGALQTLLTAVRQCGWDPALPTTAQFYRQDYPPRPPQVARHLAEHVMAQVEARANLDRWPTPEGRLITVILIRCGLRTSDACALAVDCLLHDGQGAAYLRYFNSKMNREAAVPIDEDLAAQITAQQQRVRDRWPAAVAKLFPRPHRNAAGNRCFTYSTYTAQLKRWLADCNVTDTHGRPVHLTPHQWRHTFATRLINRDVPQEVIRVLLDHQSAQMTAHYARLTDQTVRRRWEEATKVNIEGQRVHLDPDGPLAQAQWAKTRYGIATQTLPNGYCGLPIQQTCPHANACLTCPAFLTGPEFLPELREHRARTLTLIQDAQAHAHARVAQMNEHVLTNLDRMIAGIGDAEPSRADTDDQTTAGVVDAR